jgi:hypothetical protein
MTLTTSISSRCRHAWRAVLMLLPLAAMCAQPPVVTADDLSISGIWARATTPGVGMGSMYLTIENRGRQLDTLLRASSPVAGEVTFHRTIQQEGVAHMDQLWTVDVPPGRTVKFEPNGRHIMLIGLQKPLVAGTRIAVTLQFQHAGAVQVEVPVLPITATGPAATATTEAARTSAH